MAAKADCISSQSTFGSIQYVSRAFCDNVIFAPAFYFTCKWHLHSEWKRSIACLFKSNSEFKNFKCSLAAPEKNARNLNRKKRKKITLYFDLDKGQV